MHQNRRGIEKEGERVRDEGVDGCAPSAETATNERWWKGESIWCQSLLSLPRRMSRLAGYDSAVDRWALGCIIYEVGRYVPRRSALPTPHAAAQRLYTWRGAVSRASDWSGERGAGGGGDACGCADSADAHAPKRAVSRRRCTLAHVRA
eukprot:2584758-Pleurochrysis_carterae.AAC.3